MKKFIQMSFIILMGISVLFAYDGKKHKHFNFPGHTTLENVSVDMDDGTLIITSREDEELVMEITDDYDLYLNGEEIETNNDQRKIVKRYYHQWVDIVDMAKNIGIKGAKIGLEGAKLGMKAVVNLFKLMRADYDSDDYEAEIEAEAEKIEAKAEKIEIEAEEIDELVEDFEDLQKELEEEIKEIAESGIFDEH